MAIGSNDGIEKFGTQDTVTAGGGTSAVSDGAWSASGDVVSGGWTNDDDADKAVAVLTFQYSTGTIQDTIDLYGRRLNIDGTADEPQPDSGYPGKALGSFRIDTNQAASTSTSYIADIVIPNAYTSQVWEFYLYNDSNVAMSAGWTLKITPKTYGPHA